MSTLLSVRNLEVTFPTKAGMLHAVRDVSLHVHMAEKVGLVGESGCGKSTLARALMRIAPITGGQVLIDDRDITELSPRELKPVRPMMQMVFQDPYSSINPRHSIGKTIGQPLEMAGWSSGDTKRRVAELLSQVGLPATAAQRYPHEFSGGQRQRIGIARALALKPKLLICDEPVSALDVSVRAQIINLLDDLKNELGLGYLFISHDLSVVRHFADRVLVMYLGQLVETAPTETLWQNSAHPYTRALLETAPVADPRQRHTGQREILAGELPNPLRPPSGCAFSLRCKYVQERCRTQAPPLRALDDTHQVACHFDLHTMNQNQPKQETHEKGRVN